MPPVTIHPDASANGGMESRQTPNREIWLAGGCFWGLEAYLELLDGVEFTQVGYANGDTLGPTYEDVCYHNTGHAETVYVRFDEDRLPLPRLLAYFFRAIDPTTLNRQGSDRGVQYRSGIYYMDESMKPVIDAAIDELQKSIRAMVVVEVRPLRNYWPAEEYHQHYLAKNPHGYCHVDLSVLDADPGAKRNRHSAAAAEKYPRPDQQNIREKLTSLQYRVTQEEATEPPFTNEFEDNHRAGLYVDVVTGEPLFSSRDKYDSGSGWPSFTRPVSPGVIIAKADHSLYPPRVEIRSRSGNSHLGHVFDDGPPDRGGRRYCLNSAALRFIPLEKLAEEGYGDYIGLVRGPEAGT